MTPPCPSAFDERWLAEAIRLRESHAGPLDDGTAVRAARAAGGDLETRIRHRACALGSSALLDALRAWKRQSALIAGGLVLAAMLAGGAMATAVLGDGQRPVNVVWALGGLLGLHALTLLLWFAALPFGRRGGSLAGRLWLDLVSRVGRRHGAAWLPQALFEMAARARMLPAWLGRLSHGLWAVSLAAALLTMLAMLSTRRYGFVWETTILPADAFVWLTETLAWLPRQLGLEQPDAAMVLRAAGPRAVDADRQAWSAWLIGALVLYGLLPRALLWGLCTLAWRRFRGRYRLDVAEPGFARLGPRLLPAGEAGEVRDAAPAHLPAFHAGHGAPTVDGACRVMALELAADLPWPPAALPPACDGGRLDSREQRRAALDALAAHPLERLLVAVDPRLSPDRGSLALLAELSRYAHRCAVWLVGEGGERERREHWREALHALGIEARDVVDDEARALAWLEHVHG